MPSRSRSRRTRPFLLPTKAWQTLSPRGSRDGSLTVFGNLFILRCRPLIVAIGTAGETACPTLVDQSFGKVGGAGGFACRWKLISIAIQSRKRLCNPVCGEAALCYKFVLV